MYVYRGRRIEQSTPCVHNMKIEKETHRGGIQQNGYFQNDMPPKVSNFLGAYQISTAFSILSAKHI